MVIIDHLYGAIVVPEWLMPVLLSPELQRLRDVRLINTTSPSCPALSDVRRFTHSLGVLFLASRLEAQISQANSQRECRAFLIAALLHDIGTAPFGHLFEYLLNVTKNWNHEQLVEDIILGTYRPEKRYHQIYYSKSLRLHDALQQLDVDVHLVLNIIRGKESLGQVLAGSIDLDNIDGVIRMSTVLGLRPEPNLPVSLVDSISLCPQGPLFDEAALPLLKSWRDLRRLTYQILSFDEWCISGQAMLTDCLIIALEKGTLSDEHWFFTDEQLLRFLLQFPETKEIVQRFSIGDFYHTVFHGWYMCPRGDKDLRLPLHRAELADALTKETDIPCSPYIFYDSGTFSKDLTINIKRHATHVSRISLDRKSESTIISVVTPYRMNDSKCRKLYSRIVQVLEEYGLHSTEFAKIPSKDAAYELGGQKELQF